MICQCWLLFANVHSLPQWIGEHIYYSSVSYQAQSNHSRDISDVPIEPSVTETASRIEAEKRPDQQRPINHSEKYFLHSFSFYLPPKKFIGMKNIIKVAQVDVQEKSNAL